MFLLILYLFVGTPSQIDPVQKLEDRLHQLELKQAETNSYLIAIFVLAVGGLGTVGSLFIWTKKKVEKSIENRLDGKLAEVLALVDRDKRIEKQKTTSISVVSPKEKLRGTLVDLGFRGARRQELEDAKDHGRDLMVFDGDSLCDDEIQGVIAQCDDLVFLIYKHGRVNIRDERLTFANSEISLYARLMEALGYQSARAKERAI